MRPPNVLRLPSAESAPVPGPFNGEPARAACDIVPLRLQRRSGLLAAALLFSRSLGPASRETAS
jgi:hypothetical protein